MTVFAARLRAAGTFESVEELARFCIVGLSGYALNLAVFSALLGPGGQPHLLAAVGAFLVAVTNNFVLNRNWTFGAHGERARQQAWRFLTVSLLGLALNLAVLELLVRAGLPELPSQALAIAAATPFNFLLNKVWTFHVELPRRYR